MNHLVLFVCCIILSNTYQVQVTETTEAAGITTEQSKPLSGENAAASARSFSWSAFSDKISDLLVVKKNIIAAYPLQLASTLIDMLCTSTLFMHHVPQKFTPDIKKMHFQYITSCKNYSVPLMEAEKLWQHMSFNKLRKVVILATGWTNTVNDSSTLALLSKAFLCRKDVNFIGLEHLMYNLGLGQIEFEPEHTIDEHRPKGFKAIDSEDDAQLTAYFEQQSLRFSPTDDGIQILTQRVVEDKQTDELDILLKEKEKGILLEFKEMHDPKHRHPRDTDAFLDGPPLSANVCLSPKAMLRLVVDHNDLHKRKLYKTFAADAVPKPHNSEDEYNEFINHVQLTPVAFMKLCPALLAQVDQHVCMKPAPLTIGEDPKLSLWNAWIYATVSIFILSACGLLGVLLVPLMKTMAYQEILKFLVAVAIGTLAGDALMHLLPHALVPEHGGGHGGNAEDSEHESHEAVWICACAFFTCIFMYILEHILPLLKGDSNGGHGHSHGHGHAHNHGHTHAHHTEHQKSEQTTANETNNQQPPVNQDARELNIMLNETKNDEKGPSRPLTPVAFMVVIGDGLHNLTDGLAIGAAFASDPVTGMATAFAVLCHELPHELGDFALLLQTGVSLRRAIYLNIVSSVLSFLGMAIGLFIAGSHENMTQWIYAATAGSFLYIALADLVPAMSEVEGHVGDSKSKKLKGTLIQIFGMLLGGLIMLAIAVNEHALGELFK